MQHPFDLANLIHGDHELVDLLFRRLEAGQGNREVLVNQVITNLAVHATAEEQVVYPELRRAYGGDADAEEAVREHQAMKEALAVLDRGRPGEADYEEALRHLIAEVRGHIPSEEGDWLERLRAAVGDNVMVELGQSFTDHERRAPTRPHPNAPSNPLLAAPAALVDAVRDKVADRDDHAGTDASGLLNAQAQAVVDKLAELSLKPPHLLTPKEGRKAPTAADAVAKLMKERGLGGPEPVGSIEDLTIPGPVGGLDARIYRPEGTPLASSLPVVVYFHGGGWVIADLDTFDASCRGLANKAQAMVVAVDYRHAPENPFPAAHDDALAATRWIMAHAGELGGDPHRVALAGESAGGNLAAATALALKAAGDPQPVFQLLIYPVTSTGRDTASYQEAGDAKPLYSAFMEWFFGHVVADDPSRLTDRRLDLLSIPAEELAGLPPALVITAERDPLRDEGESFAEHLRMAGVQVEATRYPGTMHEFFGAAAVMDDASRAQAQAGAALRAAFQAAPAAVR